jgi:hypothetical protein
MYEHGDLFTLFTRYWWLIFPIGWGIYSLVQSWQRQRHTEKAMDIIKSYAEQGKEPPPSVLNLLQVPERGTDPVSVQLRARDQGRGLLLASLIFVALAVAFGVLTTLRFQFSNPNAQSGLIFVTVLMAGFAVAFFIAAMVSIRDAKRRETP